MRDGGVGEERRAVHALVERAVAAEGVDAQRASGGGLGLYLPDGVHGRAGDVYLVLAALGRRYAGERLVDEAYLVLRLRLAGDGVHDEEVLHYPTLPRFVFDFMPNI